jgi:predicted nuclease with TOPRIM domain
MESGEPFWDEVPYLHPEEGVDGYFLISLIRQGEAIVQTVLDISAQKRAQILLHQHSQELAAANEELQTTNEELAAANEELAQAKAALQRLNAQLEQRVVARTQELQRAQQEAQRQRQVLDTLFMEAPAPIVILEGAQLIYRLVNPAYQQSSRAECCSINRCWRHCQK